MNALPYYFVRRLPTGRWAVAHRVPGADVDAVDVEFLTLRAALTEKNRMHAKRQQDEQAAAQERKLCGVRA